MKAISADHAIVAKIVSGGQTGVDRAALDVALELGIPHGGYCPAGRRAEDGPIPARYQLTELAGWEYSERTRRNVLDSDATLILCRGMLRGGTRLTRQFALHFGKPHWVVDLDTANRRTMQRVHRRLAAADCRTLNVAGPRESQNRGIGRRAGEFLRAMLLFRQDAVPGQDPTANR